MGSNQNTIYYCCVRKGNRTLYAYSSGDHEIENLVTLCLERTPPFHRWYLQTMGKRTFGFFMEDGYIYFVILDECFGNPGVLLFLEHLRDEFKKAARKGGRESISSLNSISIEEQLVPVIRCLITSLQHVSQSGSNWMADTSCHAGVSPPSNTSNSQIEGTSQTKTPLLGKPVKHEKRKSKDDVVLVRENELQEHRRSADRGTTKGDSAEVTSNNQGVVALPNSLQKDLGPMRIRSGSQSFRKKWCRQVWIVLAVDAVVCFILFGIWLLVCRGIECIR